MPQRSVGRRLPFTALRALAHGWIDQLSRSEYDVRGDVTDLLPELPQPTAA
jgi:hypothetical protein